MIKEYTFFSYYHRTYTKTDHILGYRANLIKFKRIEIILNVFSHQNGLKLEITNRKITGRLLNIWKVNNTLLYSPWVKEEVLKEIKKYTKHNENGNTTFQNLWDTSKAVL